MQQGCLTLQGLGEKFKQENHCWLKDWQRPHTNTNANIFKSNDDKTMELEKRDPSSN